MDLLLICRDALASSFVDNLLVAIEAKKSGAQVAVLFTQEALAGVAGGTFSWPQGLSGQERRYKVADTAAKLELPVMGSGQARQLDYRQVLEKARQVDVPMFAPSMWVEFLGLNDGLPTGISVIGSQALLKMVMDAKTIIGSL